MSFDPVHKVIPAFVVGEINQENADRLIAQTQAVNDGSLRVFFSDQRPQYREAILKAFGQWMQPERQGQRGRRPKPRLVPPPDLLYAQVVKHRRKGRVVKVTTEVVFGTPEALSETVSGQPTRQHGLCGTTEQHDAPAQSALHPQDVRVFQEALLDGTAVTPLYGLLSLLSPAQWSAGRDRPSSSHEGEWVSQEVAGGHPDDGGGSDGSRMDSARVADVSGTTPGSRKYCVN